MNCAKHVEEEGYNMEKNEEKKATPEEMKDVLKATAGFFISVKMAAAIDHGDIPEHIDDLMKAYLAVVGDVIETIDLMDNQLTVEKTEDGGGKN